MNQHGRAPSLALALVLAIGVALGGCATAPARPEGPRVESISATGDDGRVEVVIEGSQPLDYTAFRLMDPPRIVLDLPGVVLGPVAGVKPAPSSLVSSLTASEVAEGASRVARIEIAVAPTTSFVVTPDSTENTLTVALVGQGARLAEPAGAAKAATLDTTLAPATEAAAPKAEGSPSAPGATPPASQAPSATPAPVAVKNVTSKTADGSTEMVVEASGPIATYEVFRLASPPRLVLDIQDAANTMPSRRVAIRNSPHVKGVRVGAYQRRVRIVLDLAGRGDWAYQVAPDPRGLVVTLMAKDPDAAKAADSPAPAAAQPPADPLASAPVEPAQAIAGRPGDGGLPSRPATDLRAGPAMGLVIPVRDSGKRYTGRRLSLDFKDADIDNILRLIAEISNLNIVTSDDVKGKLSLRLVNVPWDQALDIVLESQGLGMVRTGNVIRIAPAAKLKAEDDAAIAAKAAKQKLEDLTLEIIPVNYATAKDMEKQVKALLSDRGKVTIDDRTNALIVSDVKDAIDQARALVLALDTVTPQVLIEARIVEASLDFTREIGVQWGGTFTSSAATGNPTGQNFPGRIDVTGGAGTGFAVNLPAAIGQGSGGGLNFNLGSLTNFLNLDIRLSALERTGEGRIISSPRVTTLDNKEAIIEQGLSIPFETTSQGGTQTTFIDANLNLTVTPHVTNDESISLKIKASKNAPDTSVRGASGAPSISKKEAKTEVLVKNGHTTVIGGIFQIDRTDTVNAVPWFHRLPFLGWMFKRTTVVDKKTELLIFITPRLVRPIGQQTAAGQ